MAKAVPRVILGEVNASGMWRVELVMMGLPFYSNFCRATTAAEECVNELAPSWVSGDAQVLGQMTPHRRRAGPSLELPPIASNSASPPGSLRDALASAPLAPPGDTDEHS
jgi:hypothetical protein